MEIMYLGNRNQMQSCKIGKYMVCKYLVKYHWDLIINANKMLWFINILFCIIRLQLDNVSSFGHQNLKIIQAK